MELSSGQIRCASLLAGILLTLSVGMPANGTDKDHCGVTPEVKAFAKVWDWSGAMDAHFKCKEAAWRERVEADRLKREAAQDQASKDRAARAEAIADAKKIVKDTIYKGPQKAISKYGSLLLDRHLGELTGLGDPPKQEAVNLLDRSVGLAYGKQIPANGIAKEVAKGSTTASLHVMNGAMSKLEEAFNAEGNSQPSSATSYNSLPSVAIRSLGTVQSAEPAPNSSATTDYGWDARVARARAEVQQAGTEQARQVSIARSERIEADADAAERRRAAQQAANAELLREALFTGGGSSRAGSSRGSTTSRSTSEKTYCCESAPANPKR